MSWRVIQDSTESAKESEQSKTEFDLCEAVKVFSIDEAKRQCKCEEANAKRQCVVDLVGKEIRRRHFASVSLRYALGSVSSFDSI